MGLDTEFVREKTYYSRLCLLQVATDDVIRCVDPLAVDIAPLLDVLFDPAIVKVLHSAHQDLEIFYHLRGDVPAPLFDTQTAAALCGNSHQTGYGQAVRELCGVTLDKGATRTDWSRRPLSAAQLRYAENDVRYLGALYVELDQRLERLGRRAWLDEETRRACDPARFAGDPELAWRSLRAGRELAPAQQGVLRGLAAWRERQAQRRDQPRGWIISDTVLVRLARRPPGESTTLADIEGLSPGQVRRYGQDLLEVLARARDLPSPEDWRVSPLDAAQRKLCDRLLARVREVAEELDIPSGVLATRRAVSELISGGENLLMQGWRREVIGARLVREMETLNSSAV